MAPGFLNKVSTSASFELPRAGHSAQRHTTPAARPLLSHLALSRFSQGHGLSTSLSRILAVAALGSGKKLESHCQLGVELGHKYKMLAVTFTFQSAAKRTMSCWEAPTLSVSPTLSSLDLVQQGPRLWLCVPVFLLWALPAKVSLSFWPAQPECFWPFCSGLTRAHRLR